MRWKTKKKIPHWGIDTRSWEMEERGNGNNDDNNERDMIVSREENRTAGNEAGDLMLTRTNTASNKWKLEIGSVETYCAHRFPITFAVNIINGKQSRRRLHVNLFASYGINDNL